MAKFVYRITQATPSRRNGDVVGVRTIKTFNYAVVSTNEDDGIITHALTVTKRTADSVKSMKKRDVLKLLNAYALDFGTLNAGFSKRSPSERHAAKRFERLLERIVDTLEVVNVEAVELENYEKAVKNVSEL